MPLAKIVHKYEGALIQIKWIYFVFWGSMNVFGTVYGINLDKSLVVNNISSEAY